MARSSLSTLSGGNCVPAQTRLSMGSNHKPKPTPEDLRRPHCLLPPDHPVTLRLIAAGMGPYLRINDFPAFRPCGSRPGITMDKKPAKRRPYSSTWEYTVGISIGESIVVTQPANRAAGPGRYRGTS